ncbi:MAG: tryptophan-rich sensory protein [Paracoccus sp. (in: a-proteobacteria)]|nr:tryptophan-rich sensory protein [Paracoccus sp. (in: a-proteobacteria)]
MPRLNAILVLIFAILFALSPLASSSFNGFTPEQFPVVQDFWPVQPAGWAFSIWGLIYVWLIVGASYGLWRHAEDPDWQAMRGPLAVSLFIGIFWIAVANRAPVAATVMIVAMWAGAVLAFLRAGASRPVMQVRPVALYAGWLTAATGVAIGVTLGGYGVISPEAAALICLSMVLVAALLIQAARPAEWGYPVAVGWALAGVIAANAPRGNWLIVALGAVGIALLAAQYLRHRSA